MLSFDAFFFDLDGTLIDFNPNEFVKVYLGAAARYFKDLIPDSDYFVKSILDSTKVMEMTDTPKKLALYDFFDDFCQKFNSDCSTIIQRFRNFYNTDFNVVEKIIHPIPHAEKVLLFIRDNYPTSKIVLSTNPVFPEVAIVKRINWGGLSENLFDYITHAENSYYCKGSLNYWIELAKKLNVRPEKTLVIGNDGARDMIAKKADFKTYFLTQTAENEHSLEKYPPDYKGSLESLLDLLNKKKD